MLTNAVGLHARPSVKLTQLAKSFRRRSSLRLAPDGPWIDAKSPVQGDARQGAEGHDRSISAPTATTRSRRSPPWSTWSTRNFDEE